MAPTAVAQTVYVVGAVIDSRMQVRHAKGVVQNLWAVKPVLRDAGGFGVGAVGGVML